MENDRIKWNKRYKKREEHRSPSDIVKEFHSLAKIGRALDIACGTGRNALFLAKLGFRVDAVDISDVALDKLSGRHENIRAIHADLDTHEFSPMHYDLIVNVRFLSRRLVPYIKEALLPGGVLIFESYLEMPSDAAGGEDRWQPSHRDYLLRPNELLHSFLSLSVCYYREGETRDKSAHGFEASLVATKISR